MTAPSLLDELEEVVRLAEKATPGEWTATVGHDVKQQHGVTVMKAWAGRGPQQEHNAAYVVALVNWFRAHHAEMADMAKRLEAAERDSKRLDWVEDRAHALDWDPNQSMKRVIRGDDGAEFCGDTWREQIDAATQEGEG
jgi:hypothetical protein